MKRNNIDWQLQKELRKPVYIEEKFQFFNEKVYYKISTEEGLVFYNNGINKFHNYGYIKNKKGINLFYQSWILDASKPSIFFVHGNAENSSSHPKFFYYLLKNNFNIISFDQAGFGNSDGIRGTFDSFHDYIKNVDLIYSYFHKKLTFLIKGMTNLKGKKKKKILLTYPEFYFIGFSMGGLQVLYYTYLYNFLNNKLKLFERLKETNFQNYNKLNGIKKVILLNPWLAHHPRLVNKTNFIFLRYFNFLFSKYKLMRQDSQKLILSTKDDKLKELYLKMYKNLTDNTNYLIKRAKDKRIHRLVSKYWLSNIIINQLFLKKKIKSKTFFNTYFLNDIQYYLFLGDSDLIVDNYYTEKLFKSSFLNYNLFWLENFFHDFLDYKDKRWDYFISKLEPLIF